MWGWSDVGDEQRLAAELRRGSVPALAEVYRCHAGRVFLLASQLLHDAEEAAGVVERVFVALWERPEDFDPCEGRLRAFLLLRARRCCMEVLEARGRRPPPSGLDDPTSGWEPTAHEEDLQAVELAFFDGLSCRQIAELFGVGEEVVKARIRRGLQRPPPTGPPDTAD